MNLFDNARDTRSYLETKRDFDFGKYNEIIMFNALPEPKMKLGRDEVLGEMHTYQPDCFWMLKDAWYPLELKFTMSHSNILDFKKMQVDCMANWKGYFLVGNPVHRTIISAQQIQMMGKEVPAEHSKLNKPSYNYIFTDDDWRMWERKLGFKDKSGELIM